MKKIIFLLSFFVVGYSFMYAGTWVVGANQIADLLDKIEQGTGEAPPAKPVKMDQGNEVINTDLSAWQDGVVGVTFTPTDVNEDVKYQTDWDNGEYHWRGLLSINFAGKGYKQKESTVISFIQPSLNDFDYDGIPQGFSSLVDYWDRHQISWLETIDFSGNDFHSLEFDGSVYKTMPLKTINVSNNPNLASLSIVNCASLEQLDIRGTALSATDIEAIKESVLESAPDATILHDDLSSVKNIENETLAVYVKDNNVVVEGKALNDKVLVYDLFGRKLLESYENILDASLLDNGVYLVNINNQVTKVLKK